MSNLEFNTNNPSGRSMVKYHVTKSDPLCKWRNATPDTVVELVSWLPKDEMTKIQFRQYMHSRCTGDFFHTPYQLAVQLGLYYEDDERYIPRFHHDISISEAREYMKKWMRRYYVPNPFTKRGFINIIPSVNLLFGLTDILENHPSKNNLETAGAALCGGQMGNIGCVKYVLNQYSDLIEVDGDNVMNFSSTPPEQYDVDVPWGRYDKWAFFNYFS